MNSATNVNDVTQGEGPRERENTFQHFRSIREKCDIQINPGKTMTFLDYILSLDLDPGLFNVVQRRKISVVENVYFIELENKSNEIDKTNLKWTIRRRFNDFLILEKELNEELIEGRKMLRHHVPQLHQFYNTRSNVAPEIFLQAAENYLRSLLAVQQIREKSVVLYEFLEYSLLPLPEGTQKLKEGYLKKKSGGRFKRNKLRLYCSMFFSNWQKRWFILTEEGIIYMINSNSTKAREMILFDQSFSIEYGRKATGKKVGISLVSTNRRLNIQAKDVFEALDWVGEIKKAAKASPYTKINRYLSFAPVREPTNNCKWYVDADGYFEDLHEALMNAKKEVFITDWWLTPELYLKKPANEDTLENRLDQILGKIANNGVKVFVILYHEVKMVSYNDSEHTKRALQKMSSNITVLKHPSEPFFSWSHHEKLVVIDQTIGFIGGLDLCLGRSDTSDHPLIDPALVEGTGETFPGQDYCNPRLADFKNVREQCDTALVDKQAVPRMPFHDCHMRVIGPVVSDMCRHFIQYWNHVEIDCYGKEDEAPLPSISMVPAKDEATLRKENATNKMRSAVRKIVGLRQLTGGHIHHDTTATTAANKENVVPNVEEKPERLSSKPSYKRTQSTLPSIGGIPSIGSTGNVEHSVKDEIQVILHEKKKALNQPEEIKEEDESFNTSIDLGIKNIKNQMKMKYQNSGPAPPPQNTLLSGPDTETNIVEVKPKRVLPKLHEKIVSTENKNLPQKTLRIPNSRMVHTMHTIGQPNRYLPGSEEEKEYNKRYADLLENIRRKEQDVENELQLSRSKRVDTKNKNITRIRPGEKKLLPKLSDQFYEKNMLQLLFRPKDKLAPGTCACQMLRSASKWSLGLNANDGNVENSIQNAYIELIQNAKSFIYIENQFFMSGTAGKVVKNEVGQALVYRIEKAHARQEKFRVLVFMPLLPAFEGEIIDSKAALLRIQVHWQYMTICRGGQSIYEQLRNKGIRPEDYIQFYSLRTHARMPNGEPATEMIYIHSKVMVVDDDVLLIGSANINDRSLQGSRDSEIAMVVEDSKKMTSFMDGEEVQVGEFACTMRRRLLAEHLDLSEEEVMDPLADEFTEILNEVAERNTQIYREVFYCYPDDTQKTIKDVDESAGKRDLSKYDELAPQIQGHVVWYPLEFLSEESLTAPINTMEYYIPDQTFV